ncbi:restriction endonuclease subunit S [Lactococcus formosensis]|uniref:restriction endonuclease subunit S n=1 Tax=Lactococcus formosensis TaxID=1281486 RepID=UPI0025731F61|nr:restriction endonuclease subunit S [Lactococcus formosensis]BDW50316.1 type I restriction enzyme specificity protein [Lactococcus formosensis]BDX25892.1 type I restriction enzyme specificity protein [Lactococcus formosensis]
MAKIDDSVKKKVPELRFPGFTDDWEERKLKDIAQFNPKTVLPDEFEYVDLESVVGTEMISHRTESKDQAPSRAQRLAQKGDVFYQTVRPYQMNNYLYDLPYDNYVFSTGYAQMRPNIDSYFLLNSVQNKQFVQHVLDRSTGTSYPAINSSDLSNIEIHVPSKLSEQQKIGAFFQSIDDTIALHQRKLDLLKEQKKGYLQKMFPKNGAKVPELRFAGFADDWGLRKLGEVYNFQYGQFNNNPDNGGQYPIYGANGIIGGYDEYNSENAIVIGHMGAYAGHVLWAEGKHFVTYNGTMGIADKSILNSNFGYYLVVSVNVPKLTAGSGQPFVSYSDLNGIKILIPTIEEQQKIGSFFKQLDDTIALHQRKLDLLKEQKKGFLQKMFV